MRIVTGLVLLIGLMLVHGAARAENRALVIGINAYPQVTENGVPNAKDLGGAVHDAERFAKFLTGNFGFAENQVKLLTDAQASRGAIERQFNDWLVKGTRPGERAVFFFAGHGLQVKDENGDEPNSDKFDEALAPADAAGELGREQLRNLILDDDLNQWVARLKDRKLMVFVDACHAGTITRDLSSAIPRGGKYKVRSLTPRGPVTRGVQSSLTDEIRRRHKVNTRLLEIVADPQGDTEPVIWTATSSAQLALDTGSGGVFTQGFLNGLLEKKADSDGDGEVTVAEILRYTGEVSEAACDAHPFLCRARLTPKLESSSAYLAEVLFPYGATGKAPHQLAAAMSNKSYAEKAKSYFSHANDFGLSVEILPGLYPKLGSDVKFRVRSDKAGYLVLFDEGPDGALRQIFPNEYAKVYGKQGLIRAYAPLTIPDVYYGFAFTAGTPGPGTLIALVVEDAADFEKIVSQHLDLEALKDPGALLTALARELYRPLETMEDDKPNRRLKWAYRAVKYVVE